MEMIEIDVGMDNDLIAKTRDLAVRYFGDDSDASLGRVLEVALVMRFIWSRSVMLGQQETDEAVSTWEFLQSTITEENTNTVTDWLFRRRRP